MEDKIDYITQATINLNLVRTIAEKPTKYDLENLREINSGAINTIKQTSDTKLIRLCSQIIDTILPVFQIDFEVAR